MVNNPYYLLPILSYKRYHGIDFHIGDCLSSYQLLLNRCEQRLTLPYLGQDAYVRNPISRLKVDSGIIPFYSYLQQRDDKNQTDLESSVPVLGCHRNDNHQSKAIRQQCDRIINTLLPTASLESQILTNSLQQVRADTLLMSTLELSVLQENSFSDLTSSCDSSRESQMVRYTHISLDY
jgi:hypothetical protein